MPPVINANSSERVMPAMKGRTTSGASVWPTKTLAAVASDSLPETRMKRVMTHAITSTIFCMMPMW